MRAVGVAEVVAGGEPGERAQPPREPGQRVQVDQPEVDPVPEGAVHPLPADVADGGLVERRHFAAAHVAPSDAAARTPAAQPSSWKPQPW